MNLKFIKKLSNIFLFFTIVCFLNNQLAAQQSQNNIYLTMEEAIARTLSKNNQLRSSEFAIKKANWDKKNAWTLLFPSLSLNTRYMWIDDSTYALRDFSRYFKDTPSIPGMPVFDIPQTVFQNAYYTSLDVTMPVFNGALLNNLSTAKASEEMASHLYTSTRENVLFQVISSYLNVLRSKEILKLQQDYLNLSKMNYEKAERLYNAGRYSKTEALRWKVDYQQQKSVVVNSRSTLRSVQSVLNRLLNINNEEQVQIENQIPRRLTDESEKLASQTDEKILELINLNEMELVRANASLSAAKSNEDISKSLYRNSYSSYLPNVSMNYSYGWRENSTMYLDDYSPQTFVVNLSLPLFTSFQNLTSSKSSYYAFKQSQEQFYDQLQNTRLMLTETVNKIINLKTQRELSKANVEFSEHNYRTVSQQKEKGLISNIDFIDAKLNLQNAKLNDISTNYDFISAMVELYFMLGKLNLLI
ncbi:TolC family protein [candidate division KSB1 bacterium]|nr:TolC family protein [candidate division KSB1 bacterium]MBL7092648.1 TolC family protein [candidate division KSB1 bacterium]